MRMYGCQIECEGGHTCAAWCGDEQKCLSISLPYTPREHTDENCWCSPVLDFTDPETGVEVWVHNHPQ
jgi:hypothetical protein